MLKIYFFDNNMVMTSSIKNKIKKLTTSKLFISCCFFCFLFLAGSYSVQVEKILFFYSCVCFLFLPVDESFYFFLFTRSFICSNIDICQSTFNAFVFIFIVKYIFGLIYKDYKINKNFLIILICFLLYSCIITMFYRQSNNYEVIFYFPLFYLLFVLKDKINFRKALDFLLIGVLTSVALSPLCLILPSFSYNCFLNSRYHAFHGNPNRLYMKTIFLLVSYSVLFLRKELAGFKFISIYVILSALTILTLSKTGILMLILFSFIITIIYLKQDFKNHIEYVLYAILGLLVISLIFQNQIFTIIQRFTSSNNNSLNSLFTGRLDIWIDYCKQIFKNPITLLFGRGIFAKYAYIFEQDLARAPHNLYLYLIYFYGVVGIVFIWMMIREIFVNRQGFKFSFLNFLPLLYLLLEGLFDNIHTSFNIPMFAIAFAFLFLKNNPKKEELKE